MNQHERFGKAETGNARRMQRFRKRRNRGVIHVAEVQVYEIDLPALIDAGVLKSEFVRDRREVGLAVERVLADWVASKGS